MSKTFDWRKTWTQAKSAISKKSIGMPLSQWLSSYGSDDGLTGHSYSKAKDQYREIDIIYTITDKTARYFSQPKLVVKRVDSKGNTKPVPENHELQRLLDKPNWRQNQKSWLYSVSALYTLGGNSFSFFNTGMDELDNPKAKPLEIWQFGQDRFTLECAGNSYYYQYTPSGTDCIDFNFTRVAIDLFDKKSNVMQWNTFNPDSFAKGQSPLAAGNVNADIYEKGNLWNRTFYKKGCRPSLALVRKRGAENEAMTDDEYQQLKKEIDEAQSGIENGNGRAMLLDGIEPKELSTSPKDADFINSHDQMQKDLARMRGMPPILLSLGSDNTFDNQAVAKESFWDETIMPELEDFVLELNNNLTPRYGDDLIITIDTSGVKALEPGRVRMWERAEKTTFISINQKREMVGMDPVKGGDVILVPAGQLPLEVMNDVTGGGVVE